VITHLSLARARPRWRRACMESSRCCRRGRAPLPVILMCFPAMPVYETSRTHWLLLASCVVLRLQTVDRNLTRLCWQLLKSFTMTRRKQSKPRPLKGTKGFYLIFFI